MNKDELYRLGHPKIRKIVRDELEDLIKEITNDITDSIIRINSKIANSEESI